MESHGEKVELQKGDVFIFVLRQKWFQSFPPTQRNMYANDLTCIVLIRILTLIPLKITFGMI